MQTAAHLHDRPLERISFKGALDALRHSARAIHTRSGQPRRQDDLVDQLLEKIAADLVPHRQMRVVAHRESNRKNRPKSPLS